MFKNYLIIDTETTGIKKDDEIIELGIVNQNGKKIYHSFFNPYKEINIEAQKINHIKKNMLINKPKFIDEWPKIKNILKDNFFDKFKVS